MALCPFALLPTLGDTNAKALSGLNDDLFSDSIGTGRGSDGDTGVSDHTASTIESMLEDLGSRLFRGSLLKQMNIISLHTQPTELC